MAVVCACELLVGGMTCTACTGAVQGALLKHPGVVEAKVDILRETARVAYDSGSVTPESLCSVVHGLGFEAQVLQIFFSNEHSHSAGTPEHEAEARTKRFQGLRDPQQDVTQWNHIGTSTLAAGQPLKLRAERTASCTEITATIRLGVPDIRSAEEARRSMRATPGVFNCSFAIINTVQALNLTPLVITYRPDVVGARQLIWQLKQQGIRSILLREDPLEPQVSSGTHFGLDGKKQAVLEAQASVRNALYFSVLPAVAVVFLSVLGRRHKLPASLVQEVVPGLQLSTLLLLLLSTPIQFYGGHSFHIAALKGLKHGHLSMDLLISVGSTAAFIYSVFSCIQEALTSMWCRPLLMASAAAAVSTAVPETAFHELLGKTEPQNFFDTCAMLTCVVLLGKLLQLRAKARILTELHSLHSLQAKDVRLVVRSSIPAVASHLLSEGTTRISDVETKDYGAQEQDALADLSDAGLEDTLRPAPVKHWWRWFASALRAHSCQHKYDPLSHPTAYCIEEEGADETSGRPPCCKTKNRNMNRRAGNEIEEELVISAELLQIGDVVRVAPNEIIPADCILLAPEVLHVDERLISGEGRGVARLASQRLIGGSRNASSVDAFMRVEVVGDASVLHTLFHLVNTAQQQHVPLQKLAESFASYFIPGVLCIMVAAITIWMVKVFATSETHPLSPLQHVRHRFREAQIKEGIVATQQQELLLQELQRLQQHQEAHGPRSNFLAMGSGQSSAPLEALPSTATLLSPAATAAAAAACRLSSWAVAWDSILFALRFGVAVCCAACPCAIGLAAPAAVAAATAAAAARGIFFKSGKALETAAKANLLVLDKTGTLTTGELQVAACAVHTELLSQLFLPPALKTGRCATKLAQATGDAAATILSKPSCCCSRSLSYDNSSTKQGCTNSLSETVPGSVSPEVTVDDRVLPSQHSQEASTALSTMELSVLQCSSTAIEEAVPPRATSNKDAGLQPPDRAICFLNMKGLWKAPSATAGDYEKGCESTWSPSSSISTVEQQHSACCRSICKSDGHPTGGDSSSICVGTEQQVHKGIDSKTTQAIGCFLWALSCLEHGSSHAVGMALVSAYDRWLRTHAAFANRDLEGAAKTEVSCDTLRPAQQCEDVLLLARGVEGLLRPKQFGPPVRLRVAAASPEDGNCSCLDKRCSWVCALCFCDAILQAWTEWHESHTGPVVSLHAFLCFSKGSSEAGAWVWLGSIALEDEIQNEAKTAIRFLKEKLGFEVFMCTGDNPRTAARVATAFGIPLECVRAQQKPEDKVAFLRSLHAPAISSSTEQLSSEETVGTAGDKIPAALPVQKQKANDETVCCMIGDGLNDSPALAAAALGVAFGVGSALPIAAADVAVGGSSWTEIVDLFRIAKKMRSIIQWNFLWACAFNIIAVPLAAGVAYPTVSLHPAAAAAAMAGSCLVVLLNAQRLSQFKGMTLEKMNRELFRLKNGVKISPDAVSVAARPSCPGDSLVASAFLPSDGRQLAPLKVLPQASGCDSSASTGASGMCCQPCAGRCGTSEQEGDGFPAKRRCSLLSDMSVTGELFEFEVQSEERSPMSAELLA
ncbi:hypothetical protein Efla_001902 [Eimeria flavescens]